MRSRTDQRVPSTSRASLVDNAAMMRVPPVFLARVACGASLLLVTAMRSTGACQSVAPPVDSAAIVELTMRQLALDRAALGLPLPSGLGGDQLLIERLDSVGRVQIYRVTPWVLQHWHPYLVAACATGVHPLGGFPAPAPLSVASQAGVLAKSDPEVVRLARTFAKLLDPNGSGDIAFVQDSLSSDELRMAWSRAARRGFPDDTIVRTLTGGAQVRLTVLSHLARQYPPAWQPVTFVFEFGASGELEAWAMRTAEPSFALDRPG
jgi:hypothetical protein